MKPTQLLLGFFVMLATTLSAQDSAVPIVDSAYQVLKWRNIGPFRGGRSVASVGVIGDPLTYYMGTTGGGLWKTEDAGQHWRNISDGQFKTGSVGAIAIADHDPNVIYVGMGEHAPRGVMTTHGDGVYKSTDAGKSWTHVGLTEARHISRVLLHPDDEDMVYIAAQGALHGPNAERGVYRSTDGGRSWERTLFVDENTGASHLAMDPTNPRIIYATMWDHRRLPWQVRSGGPGSGLYKSTDGGISWKRLANGLPKELGKMSVSLSADNPDRVYLLAESDSNAEKGGLFVSTDAGVSFARVSSDHRLTQRAWYYIEVFADPNDEYTVYVLNSPVLKSIDGGKTFKRVSGRTHSDMHDLWINPNNSRNMVLSNDGGAAITFNGGKSWSTQDNMPTAQFYRLAADNSWPYRIYAGQQDNSSVRIASRDPNGYSIGRDMWSRSAGGESAFLAFDPDNPTLVMGGSYQGTIEALNTKTGESRAIMAAPIQYLARDARDLKYRFNWNAPIVRATHEPDTYYHGGNKLLKTTDQGRSWTEISGDLTRNEDAKQGKGGAPYTNEAAGAENYGTLSYVVESPHEAGTIWTGSDDGLVQLTRDGGKSWINVTPKNLDETLINAIEISPHDPATAYIATTRYKFNDLRPATYKTTDYGKSWTAINDGIPAYAYTRVVREDPVRKGLLFAGTEAGLYVSENGGRNWRPFQRNLPVAPITDLLIAHDDLIAATSGRAFWILDDLELLRQPLKDTATVQLFQPADTYRVSGGSPMDGSIKSFSGMSGQAGVNPASGVPIYFHLPSSATKETLTLAIVNAAGETVRTYSSEKDKDFKRYAGGPSAEPTVPRAKGLNRLVWNGRHESILGAPEAYIEGSYAGPRAAPGRYTVRLRVGEEPVLEQAFNYLPTPDATVTPADFTAQETFTRQVAERTSEIHRGVNELQKLKQKLERDLDDVSDETLRQEIKSFVDDIDSWDGQLIQRKSKAYDDVINYPNGLTADYLFLHGQANQNAAFITEGMKTRWLELEAAWKPLDKQRKLLLETAKRLRARVAK